MKMICQLALIAFMTLASVTHQVPTAAAESNSTPERFEVSAVKAARPFLVATLAAVQQGNLTQAKEAFEAYDSAWNGIEVYINVRSRTLYQGLELDLQAKISKALDMPNPDVAGLLADAQMMLAKYDEAIEL